MDLSQNRTDEFNLFTEEKGTLDSGPPAYGSPQGTFDSRNLAQQLGFRGDARHLPIGTRNREAEDSDSAPSSFEETVGSMLPPLSREATPLNISALGGLLTRESTPLHPSLFGSAAAQRDNALEARLGLRQQPWAAPQPAQQDTQAMQAQPASTYFSPTTPQAQAKDARLAALVSAKLSAAAAEQESDVLIPTSAGINWLPSAPPTREATPLNLNLGNGVPRTMLIPEPPGLPSIQASRENTNLSVGLGGNRASSSNSRLAHAIGQHPADPAPSEPRGPTKMRDNDQTLHEQVMAVLLAEEPTASAAVPEVSTAPNRSSERNNEFIIDQVEMPMPPVLGMSTRESTPLHPGIFMMRNENAAKKRPSRKDEDFHVLDQPRPTGGSSPSNDGPSRARTFIGQPLIEADDSQRSSQHGVNMQSNDPFERARSAHMTQPSFAPDSSTRPRQMDSVSASPATEASQMINDLAEENRRLKEQMAMMAASQATQERVLANAMKTTFRTPNSSTVNSHQHSQSSTHPAVSGDDQRGFSNQLRRATPGQHWGGAKEQHNQQEWQPPPQQRQQYQQHAHQQMHQRSPFGEDHPPHPMDGPTLHGCQGQRGKERYDYDGCGKGFEGRGWKGSRHDDYGFEDQGFKGGLPDDIVLRGKGYKFGPPEAYSFRGEGWEKGSRPERYPFEGKGKVAPHEAHTCQGKGWKGGAPESYPFDAKGREGPHDAYAYQSNGSKGGPPEPYPFDGKGRGWPHEAYESEWWKGGPPEDSGFEGKGSKQRPEAYGFSGKAYKGGHVEDFAHDAKGWKGRLPADGRPPADGGKGGHPGEWYPPGHAGDEGFGIPHQPTWVPQQGPSGYLAEGKWSKGGINDLTRRENHYSHPDMQMQDEHYHDAHQVHPGATCKGGDGGDGYSKGGGCNWSGWNEWDDWGGCGGEAPITEHHFQEVTAEVAPSLGSIGHPHNCALACKYCHRPRGCKDGYNCTRCHLCPWRRQIEKMGEKSWEL